MSTTVIIAGVTVETLPAVPDVPVARRAASLAVLGDSTAVGLGDPLPAVLTTRFHEHGRVFRLPGPLRRAVAPHLIPHTAALVLRDLLDRPAAVPSRCAR